MGKSKKRQKQKNKKINKVGRKVSPKVSEDSLADGSSQTVAVCDDCLTMTVKTGTKVDNVMKFARKNLEGGKCRKILWTGSGNAITRTISCAESLKRQFPLQQVTEIRQESFCKGATKMSPIPSIDILQTLDKIDPSTPGYQNPEIGTIFWMSTCKKNIDVNSEISSQGRSPKRCKIQESGGSTDRKG